MASLYYHSRPQSEGASQIQNLLARYPRLTDPELAKLIDEFPKLSLLDQGLMTADDQLSTKMAEFRRDHTELLRSEKAGLIAFGVFPLLAAGFGLWWAFA